MSRIYDPSVNGIRFVDLSGVVAAEFVGPEYQTESQPFFLKSLTKIKNGELRIQTYQVDKTVFIEGTQKQFVWRPKLAT